MVPEVRDSLGVSAGTFVSTQVLYSGFEMSFLLSPVVCLSFAATPHVTSCTTRQATVQLKRRDTTSGHHAVRVSTTVPGRLTTEYTYFCSSYSTRLK